MNAVTCMLLSRTLNKASGDIKNEQGQTIGQWKLVVAKEKSLTAGRP